MTNELLFNVCVAFCVLVAVGLTYDAIAGRKKR
jgi:hypothetical protein